jgi:LacI family transcriptional regulator
MVERVKAVALTLGYAPNALAQSFKHQHLDQIAFAVEDIGNPAYLAMVRAIEPVLQQAGIRLLLHSTGASVHAEIELLRSLSRRYVDGLILSPIRVTDELVHELASASTPVVVVGTIPGESPVDNVRVDSKAGAALAVHHLAAQGCRRIGFLNGPVDTTPGNSRLAGYQAGLEEAGLVFDQSLLETSASFHFDEGLIAAKSLLDHQKVDGILGANDALAVSAIHQLGTRGLTAGRDVRVVGMDDGELASISLPRLTSVNLGAAQRGTIAAQLLLDRLRGEAGPPRLREVVPFLTVRESSQ